MAIAAFASDDSRALLKPKARSDLSVTFGLRVGLTVDCVLVTVGASDDEGCVVGCSDMFYGSPTNLVSPGLPRSMADGWETARRRDDGNDWVTLRLAGAGIVRFVELDTSNLKGNAPGWASVSGRETYGEWVPLLPKTRLQPDTRHRFALPDGPEISEARLDIYPDGGLARLRLFGRLTEAGRTNLKARFDKTR